MNLILNSNLKRYLMFFSFVLGPVVVASLVVILSEATVEPTRTPSQPTRDSTLAPTVQSASPIEVFTPRPPCIASRNGSDVNVRFGPGTEFPIVAYLLDADDVVQISGYTMTYSRSHDENYLWYYGTYRSNNSEVREVWVYAGVTKLIMGDGSIIESSTIDEGIIAPYRIDAVVAFLQTSCTPFNQTNIPELEVIIASSPEDTIIFPTNIPESSSGTTGGGNHATRSPQLTTGQATTAPQASPTSLPDDPPVVAPSPTLDCEPPFGQGGKPRECR
jgi:hypothetical protein